MILRKAIKCIMAFSLIIILSSAIFLVTTVWALVANFPLEIIQPRPNLNILNRYYKAYPKIEYNVRLAVIGGLFPYHFELMSGPPGMTINRKGEISWMSPIEKGSPHGVTVRVTDSESSQQTVKWTITVTRSGFRFIDSINGTAASQGGTGTISNPWKGIKDWYEGNDYASKYKKTYAGEFLYYRSGTYLTDDIYKEDDGIRIPLAGNNKPQVWLAYPRENPVINLGGAHIAIYGDGTNSYFEGLEFNVNGNARGMGIAIESSASHVTFRKNKFYGITNGYTGGNNALVFISKSGDGKYYSLQDNIGYDVNNGYWLLGYTASKVLVENNSLFNIYPHPISPKANTKEWFIRGNHINNCTGNGVLVQYYATSADIEISHNLIQMSGSGTALRLNSEYTTKGGPIYILRNTLVGQVEIIKATSTNGPFFINNNVIINKTTYRDKIQRTAIEDRARLIIINNLSGNVPDNIIDIKGNLTSAYSSYLGTHGYQTVKEETVGGELDPRYKTIP